MINEREVGPDAVRDRHLLEAAVERPRQSAFGDDAYGTIHLKAAALMHAMHSIITRVATPATEEMLVELARHLTVTQLERVVRGRQFVARRDAAAVQASEELCVDQDHEEHCASVRARITPEGGATALERSRSSLMSEMSVGGSREPPDEPDQADPADKPRRPTNVDAQEAIATAFGAPSALLKVAGA